MDVHFRTIEDTVVIKIGLQDTIRDLKKKIEDMLGVRASEMILLFQGTILQNAWIAAECGVGDASEVEVTSQASKILQLEFPFTPPVSIDINSTETVKALKQRVFQLGNGKFERDKIRLLTDCSGELEDEHTIADYGLVHKTQIFIYIGDGSDYVEQPPTGDAPLPPQALSKRRRETISTKKKRSKKIKVRVLIGIDVDTEPSEKVETLRTKLQQLKKKGLPLDLPSQYVMLYNREIMDEKKTFQFHQLRDKDIIEVVKGRESTDE